MGYRSKPYIDMEHSEALGGDDCLCENEHGDSIYDHGFDFQVKMLSLSSHLLQPLNTLSIFIVKYVIGILISSFRMTWLSICGLTLATSKFIGLIFSCKHISIGLYDYLILFLFRLGCKTIWYCFLSIVL